MSSGVVEYFPWKKTVQKGDIYCTQSGGWFWFLHLALAWGAFWPRAAAVPRARPARDGGARSAAAAGGQPVPERAAERHRPGRLPRQRRHHRGAAARTALPRGAAGGVPRSAGQDGRPPAGTGGRGRGRGLREAAPSASHRRVPAVPCPARGDTSRCPTPPAPSGHSPGAQGMA